MIRCGECTPLHFPNWRSSKIDRQFGHIRTVIGKISSDGKIHTFQSLKVGFCSSLFSSLPIKLLRPVPSRMISSYKSCGNRICHNRDCYCLLSSGDRRAVWRHQIVKNAFHCRSAVCSASLLVTWMPSFRVLFVYMNEKWILLVLYSSDVANSPAIVRRWSS